MLAPQAATDGDRPACGAAALLHADIAQPSRDRPHVRQRDHTTSLHAVRKLHWLQRELELELRRDDLLIAWVDLAHVKIGESPTKVLPWPLMGVA